MVNKKLVLLAILLSVATAVGIYVYLQGLQQNADHRSFVPVLVARETIPSRTVIGSGMVEIKKIPADYAHPSALKDIKSAVGAVSSQEIFEGEQVLASKVVAQDDTSQGLAFLVPQGKRAVSIPANVVSGLSYLVRPGDHVDILTTLDLEDKSSGEKIATSQTSTLLQNILVLAVGKILQPKSENDGQEVTTVTVAVTPTEAQPLVLATERGTIRLALRSPVDNKTLSIAPIRLELFLKRGE
ncbi:MAG: Flp pilus assembly protein CpaB [Bacillota bacterium]